MALNDQYSLTLLGKQCRSDGAGDPAADTTTVGDTADLWLIASPRRT